VSSDSHSPGQRKMAEWRARKASSGQDVPAEAWEKSKRGNHFGKLDDREWAAVWSVVVGEIGPGVAHKESGFRRIVDDAALESRFFDDPPGHVRFVKTASGARKCREEMEKYLLQLERLRDLSMSFWTPCVITNGLVRGLVPRLDDIESLVERQFKPIDEGIQDLMNPPSASLPERDEWMAWLCIAWANLTGRPAINRKPLRQFIVAATAPHRLNITDDTAKNFIRRWKRGEVPTPGRPFSPALRDLVIDGVN
jgi:hypothetical protein